jgi:hypothetical protein
VPCLKGNIRHGTVSTQWCDGTETAAQGVEHVGWPEILENKGQATCVAAANPVK